MKNLLFTLTFLPGILFAQSKQEINNEISSLKIENNSLREKNQALEIKVATLETDIVFIQKQIDDLKLQLVRGNTMNNEASPSSNVKNQPQQEKQESVNNGQCKATTQKGTRCSRSAKPNGFCYQHGGN